MAKKKNSSKKHKFKYVDSAGNAGTAVAEPVSGAMVTEGAPGQRPVRSVAVAGTQTVRDFSYVGGDLRRIAALATVLIGVELVLYYLLAHTALGGIVNNLVKL